jgi:2-phosphosulfolactate phosphatase
MPERMLDVCFTPGYLDSIQMKDPVVIAVVDILRASTSICTAFAHGVHRIIPVADIGAAEEHKKSGRLVAAERGGVKIGFADFGNSPFEFTTEKVKGKTLVYSTTNCTYAIEKAAGRGKVLVTSFVNLEAAAGWMAGERTNIVILCAGWKDRFALEDAVFAGALAEKLLAGASFWTLYDATKASITIWKEARKDLMAFLSEAEHVRRLMDLGLEEEIRYCFSPLRAAVVPVLRDGVFSDIKGSSNINNQ